MARPERVLMWPLSATPHASVSRRRFLTSLGLLAGAGALAPLLARTAGRTAQTLDVTRPGLGTWIRVVARHGDPAIASRAVESAFAAVARVDAQMSVHRADSELSRVNRVAGSETVEVSEELSQVVAMACDGARRTDGVYDPTVLPLMKAYGFYGPTDAPYPSDREVAAALERVGARGVEIAPGTASGTLGLTHAGAGLDLGSIGKGWAVDRAVFALRAEGVSDGLVDAGGNIYAFGSPDGATEGWSVGVLHPITRRVDRTFLLRDTGIATSGNYEQYRILSRVRVGHLLDARRGRPADGHLSATVQAADATRADLMSTVAFLLGPDRFHWPEAAAVHFVG